MNDYTNSVRNRINTFESQYNAIKKSVSKYGRYNTWLYFKCNGLELDTAAQDKMHKHLILQTWEHNKNGSGAANDFTLRICYNFAEAAERFNKPEINYVDAALCLNSIIQDNQGYVKALKSNAEKIKCKFRYGYINVGDNNEQILSPEYEGMVLHCKPELRDGMLFYEISGTSTIYSSINYQFDFDGTDEILAPDLAERVLQQYYGDGSQDSPYKTSGKYAIVNKAEDSKLYSKEQPQSFPAVQGQTVFDYIRTILGQANLDKYIEECGDKYSKGQYAYYDFYVDDIDGQKSIVIDVSDPYNTLGTTNSNGIDYDTSINFIYPDKDQNFIQAFTPEIDLNRIWGSIILSDETAKQYGIDEGGRFVVSDQTDDSGWSTVTSVEPPTAASATVPTSASGENGGSDPEKVTSKESGFGQASLTRAFDQVFTASLACLGIPSDIPINTRIRITPILNGSEYWFSGVYLILGCSDRIDSSGYITEMKVIRMKNSMLNKA